MQDSDHPKVPSLFDASDRALSPAMSEHAFALWGADDIAYIKQVTIENQLVWAIFAADGSTLGAVQERDLAFAVSVQNDRTPVSVH